MIPRALGWFRASAEHPWALQGEKSEQLVFLLLYLGWPSGRLTQLVLQLCLCLYIPVDLPPKDEHI